MTNLLKDFRKFALDKTNVKRDSLDYVRYGKCTIIIS